MDAYARYGRALLRKAERILGSRADAQDLVHALFVDLLSRGDEPDLPYLYRAITNRCLTFLRDETNRARILAGGGDTLRGQVRTRCDDRVVDLDLLAKLVTSLEPGTVEVLVYRFFDDMTQEEIAAMLGLSRKTIQNRLDDVRDAVARLGGGS